MTPGSREGQRSNYRKASEVLLINASRHKLRALTIVSLYKFASLMLAADMSDELPPQVGSDGFTLQSARTMSDPTQSCDSVRHQGCSGSSSGLSSRSAKAWAMQIEFGENLRLTKMEDTPCSCHRYIAKQPDILELTFRTLSQTPDSKDLPVNRTS
jgi:hypothetical protein